MTRPVHKTESRGDLKNANFPMDAEGRTYHLEVKEGQVANRVLVVGDPERAKLVAGLLDSVNFTHISPRGFITYTGVKNGKPVTVMSIGMGIPMIDFAIREMRAVTKGPMSIVRLGSCGTPQTDIPVGSVVVANQSFGITTHYDAFHNRNVTNSVFYQISQPLESDKALHQSLISQLEAASGGTFRVFEGLDATADSFYGSQGRIDPNFDDQNMQLIDQILAKYPKTASLQMETFHLLHLAKMNQYALEKMGKTEDCIHAAACAFVLAQRKSNEFLGHKEKHRLELKTGEAALQALIQAE